MKTYGDLVNEARRMVREISVDELAARRKAGEPMVLLDVRDPEEYAQVRIPGAINLPRGLLELEVGAHVLDPNALIVCNCGGGGRSALAAKTLQEMGYTNVASLAGGLKAWMNRNLPLEA